jgi:hypothetical protein
MSEIKLTNLKMIPLSDSTLLLPVKKNDWDLNFSEFFKNKIQNDSKFPLNIILFSLLSLIPPLQRPPIRLLDE